jgi:hypothetical protein
MIEIKTELNINAPAKDIWRKLMNFSEYSSWNSFITKITGAQVVGSKLSVEISPPGKKSSLFNPTLIQLDENKAMRWVGAMGSEKLFRGEHYFCLESIDETTTRFIHGEIFSGWLSKPLLAMMGKSIRAGFVAMNEGLQSIMK